MRNDQLRLRVNSARVAAEVVRGDRVLWSGEAEYAGLSDLTDVIARLAIEPELVGPGARVHVELERPMVQCRILHDLPAITENDLRLLVERQSHRYFRKNGKPLVVDAGYLSRSNRSKGVCLAATEEPAIAAIWDGVRAAGLALERISPAGLPGTLSLLPLQERQRRNREKRLSLRRLGIAAGILWLLAGVATAISMAAQGRSVERELSLLEEPVAALAALQREIATGKAMIGAIDADASRNRTLFVFLAAVTSALPDSAFLTSFTLDSIGRGFMGGYARRPSEVIARLERFALVSAPSLDVQAGREVIAGIEWERFSIGFGSEVP